MVVEVIGQQGCMTDEVVMFVVVLGLWWQAARSLYELGSDSGGKMVVIMVVVLMVVVIMVAVVARW